MVTKETSKITVEDNKEFSDKLAAHLAEIVPHIDCAVFLGVGGEDKTFYMANASSTPGNLAYLIGTAMIQDESFKEAVKMAIRYYNAVKDSKEPSEFIRFVDILLKELENDRQGRKR